MLKIIYLFFSLIYVFLLPGWILTLPFSKKFKLSTRFFISFGLSVIIIPLASFSIAILMGTFVKETLILGLATLINTVGLIVILLKRLINYVPSYSPRR